MRSLNQPIPHAMAWSSTSPLPSVTPVTQVVFTYPARPRHTVLNGLSFTVNPGAPAGRGACLCNAQRTSAAALAPSLARCHAARAATASCAAAPPHAPPRRGSPILFSVLPCPVLYRRRGGCAGGPQRRRQELHHKAAAALLRAAGGGRPHRRPLRRRLRPKVAGEGEIARLRSRTRT